VNNEFNEILVILEPLDLRVLPEVIEQLDLKEILVILDLLDLKVLNEYFEPE
jgi:hemerythrin superfamily protein